MKCIKKWEIFPGKNRIYCDGRLIMARQTGVFFVTIFIILATSILFFVFDCPFLTHNVSIAIPIVSVVILFFVFATLFKTSFIDPGIIPRACLQEAEYVARHIEQDNENDDISNVNPMNQSSSKPSNGVSMPCRYKEVNINGQTVKLKYCFTCKIYRPPRASHCSLCDNCIERFDHHCPWVGNCVGKRNYRFFYMFLVSLTILCIFILACSITHLVLIMKKSTLIDALRTSPASLVVAIICFFSIWSILGLTGFHTYLSTSEQTTNEDIKGTFSNRKGRTVKNPYSRGSPLCNWFNVLCGPMPPSLIDLRGTIPDPTLNQDNGSRGFVIINSPNNSNLPHHINSQEKYISTTVLSPPTYVPPEVVDKIKSYLLQSQNTPPQPDPRHNSYYNPNPFYDNHNMPYQPTRYPTLQDHNNYVREIPLQKSQMGYTNPILVMHEDDQHLKYQDMGPLHYYGSTNKSTNLEFGPQSQMRLNTDGNLRTIIQPMEQQLYRAPNNGDVCNTQHAPVPVSTQTYKVKRQPNRLSLLVRMKTTQASSESNSKINSDSTTSGTTISPDSNSISATNKPLKTGNLLNNNNKHKNILAPQYTPENSAIRLSHILTNNGDVTRQNAIVQPLQTKYGDSDNNNKIIANSQRGCESQTQHYQINMAQSGIPIYCGINDDFTTNHNTYSQPIASVQQMLADENISSTNIPIPSDDDVYRNAACRIITSTLGHVQNNVNNYPPLFAPRSLALKLSSV